MFDLGIQELVVIFVVALLVFGPKRLPELGKSLGKGLLELRKAMEGIKEQMNAESETISGQVEGSPELEKKSEADIAKETGQKHAGVENTDVAADVKVSGEKKGDTVNDG